MSGEDWRSDVRSEKSRVFTMLKLLKNISEYHDHVAHDCINFYKLQDITPGECDVHHTVQVCIKALNSP
jgi:hypothetical protein